MYRVITRFSFDRLYEVGEMLEELPPDGLPLWISMGLVELVEDGGDAEPHQPIVYPVVGDE